jgi:teichuronic acid biosynthesis protein TuaE
MQFNEKLKPVYQILLAVIFAIVMGWSLAGKLNTLGPDKIILGAVAMCGGIAAGIVIMRKLPVWIPSIMRMLRTMWERYDIAQFLLYLFVAASFLGSGILSVKVGPLTLFPYRILLPIAALIFFVRWVKSRELGLFANQAVKPALMFCLFWIGFALLSMTWSLSITDAVKDIFFLVSGLFFIFLFVYLFTGIKDYIALHYIWLIVMVFMIALGFWNYFTQQQLPVSRLHNAALYVRHRPTAVFTNENDFASYLALSFFMALGAFHYSKYYWVKLIAIFLAGSSLFQILATSSRANLLAVGIGLFVWALFFTTIKEKRILVILGGVGLVFASILFYQQILDAVNVVWKLIGSAFTLGGTGATDSTSIRVNLLINAAIFIASSGGIGIGAGNIELYMKLFSELSTAGIVNIHNWWAEILVHYGTLVFAGYIILYPWLIKELFKLFWASKTSEDKMISLSLCTSLAAFSLASISPSSLMTLNYSWILFAFSIGYVNYRLKRIPQKETIR